MLSGYVCITYTNVSSISMHICKRSVEAPWSAIMLAHKLCQITHLDMFIFNVAISKFKKRMRKTKINVIQLWPLSTFLGVCNVCIHGMMLLPLLYSDVPKIHTKYYHSYICTYKHIYFIKENLQRLVSSGPHSTSSCNTQTILNNYFISSSICFKK